MLDTALLLAAAFVAGALNAVAGGGSFLTLPALVFTGVPPVLANATGTVALLPGYVAGAWGFKDHWQTPPSLGLRGVIAWSLVGGALGATLLLVTPDATFRRIVPWLLLGATVLFALAPQIRQWTATGRPASSTRAALGLLAVSAYGGYFNGGVGIVLLALLGLLGQTQLHSANGMKNLVSVLLTAIAVCLYAWGGLVMWPQALTMAVAATLGGYGGARIARRIPPNVLRGGIVLTGLVMAALFFWRQ